MDGFMNRYVMDWIDKIFVQVGPSLLIFSNNSIKVRSLPLDSI